LAKVCRQICHFQDLRQGGRELEYFHGQDAVESVRRVGQGVWRTAGEVCVLLAGDAGVGDHLEVGDVGGGDGFREEGAGAGLDAGVAQLAVRLLHLRAGVASGSAGGGAGGRGQAEVASAGAEGDGRAGGSGVDDVGGRIAE